MSRTTLKELAKDFEKYADKQVEVSGWVRTIRDSKNFAFIELNDGTFFKSTQIIADACLENYKTVVSQNVGAGISVLGKVVVTPDMKQPYEIKAEKIVIEATSTPSYPLQKKRHTME
ncbi:MAG: asparagine--tRNA ligase, partial [Clostridia bacterium]|nr:asparagine--tRNA ligase [Clostridia bacterium]